MAKEIERSRWVDALETQDAMFIKGSVLQCQLIIQSFIKIKALIIKTLKA